MLSHLHIQSYALISELDIDFKSGFSVITGETGAGKSIILGALNFVLGGRADTKSIYEGRDKCIIEAEFMDCELPDFSSDLLIRRELHANGRSRSFVNDELITQAELKQLATKLIDIHSQHQNLLMADSGFQLDVVDAIAFDKKNADLLTDYKSRYEAYTTTLDALREIRRNAKENKQNADYLHFQLERLQNANLTDGEMEMLEQEQYTLSHAEQIKEALLTASELIDGEQTGAVALVHQTRLDSVAPRLAERLQAVEIELRDINAEALQIADSTEADPAKLEETENRISLLTDLMRKHDKKSVSELIQLRDDLQKQCEEIDNYDEQIAELEKRLESEQNSLDKAANLLTDIRKAVKQDICATLSRNLQNLGMPHAKFDIAVTPADDYTERGKDIVQFLFAANLGQTLRPVGDIASGGEISRIMLCIKSLIASQRGLPTIIFDEIDTGISGEVASQTGMIMRSMAEKRQIIAITHLPQIAAAADTQYKVYKADTDLHTETHISKLQDEERVKEIAMMLSGKMETEASLQTARQLLLRLKQYDIE